MLLTICVSTDTIVFHLKHKYNNLVSGVQF